MPLRRRPKKARSRATARSSSSDIVTIGHNASRIRCRVRLRSASRKRPRRPPGSSSRCAPQLVDQVGALPEKPPSRGSSAQADSHRRWCAHRSGRVEARDARGCRAGDESITSPSSFRAAPRRLRRSRSNPRREKSRYWPTPSRIGDLDRAASLPGSGGDHVLGAEIACRVGGQSDRPWSRMLAGEKPPPPCGARRHRCRR